MKRMTRKTPFHAVRTVVSRLYIPFIALAAIISPPAAAHASGIVTVQSMSIKPYNDAVDGFRSSCECSPSVYVADEMTGESLDAGIASDDPDLIIAVGMKALKQVVKFRDIPVVYMMILDPGPVISGRDNITGVDILIPPDKQVSIIKRTMPHINNIGLLFDPSRNEEFAEAAATAADENDLNLITREIHQSRDILDRLNSLRGEIGALWMIPDLTVITPETVELMFLYSIKHHIPVITFSDKYLDMGAIMSLGIDTRSIGTQAWDLAHKILSGREDGTDAGSGGIHADKVNVTFNLKTAKKFGLVPVNDVLIRAIAVHQN